MSSTTVSAALPPASKTVLSIVSQLDVPSGLSGLAEETEHRLVAGIAIGLLPVGQRLPSEEVMAQRFSMAPLTFRRSLDRLRTRGLITTRPGRGGGTTVTALPRPEDLGTEFDLTRAEASDLAVGLGAVLGQCARFAAMRAEPSDLELLRHQLRLVENAANNSQRRRAEMMLMVGLAAVARSERLKRAAVPMIGRLQLLRWSIHPETRFADPGPRALPAQLAGVVRVVQERNAAAAQSKVEAMIMTACDSIRLGMGGAPGGQAVLERERVGTARLDAADRFDHLTGALDRLRALLEQAAENLSSSPHLTKGKPRAGRRLDDAFLSIIHGESMLVRGAGIAYAPGFLEDPPLWLDWWDSEDGGEVTFKPHAFSATSVQFYDYTLMSWFREPQITGRFGAFGPYIDQGGVEQLTVTAASPIMEGALVGSVVGADLRPSGIDLLMYRGGAADSESAVLSASGRVVCSSVPGVLVGDLLHDEEWRSVRVDDLTGWRLVLPS